LVLLAQSFARADERSQAKEHYINGTKAFDLGAYDDAINEYSAAYRLNAQPELLYNIAQAHRLAGHTTEAVRFYRMFLVRSPNAANRGEVEQKIAELQKLLDQQKRTQNMPPDQPKPPEPVAPSTLPSATAPQAAATVAPAPPLTPTEAKGRRLKLAGIGVAAAGVALVVAGGVMVGQAQSANNAIAQNGVFNASAEDRRNLDQKLDVAFFAAGGAAVVAGAVLYTVGHRMRPHHFAVMPTTNGAALAGSF
jgi:iron complex outermembrane receptor protein